MFFIALKKRILNGKIKKCIYLSTKGGFLEEYLIKLLSNSLFIISVAITLGILISRLEFKGFKLGASGILFSGILLSELIYKYLEKNVAINGEVFNISLIGFIVSVGLIASANLVPIVKKYGFQFIVLSIVVTVPSVILVLILGKIFPNLIYELAGSYVGSLTSSPGLANALELASSPVDMSANVGLGYAIAYLPGVVSVIMFGQIFAKRSKLKGEISISTVNLEYKEDSFSVSKLIKVIMVGIVIGTVSISVFGLNISFGITGGCLISSLVFGAFIKGYKMEESKLSVIKTISLYMFLAIIGLNYGHKALGSILTEGKIIFPFAIFSAQSAILVGCLFGKKVLKMDSALLAGAICGAMTSTPGLAATYKAFDDKNVVTGYGATYPFGLILKIVFIKFLI